MTSSFHTSISEDVINAIDSMERMHLSGACQKVVLVSGAGHIVPRQPTSQELSPSLRRHRDECMFRTRVFLDLTPLEASFTQNFRLEKYVDAYIQYQRLQNLESAEFFLIGKLPDPEDEKAIRETRCFGAAEDRLSIYEGVNYFMMATADGENPDEVKRKIRHGMGKLSPSQCLDHLYLRSRKCTDVQFRLGDVLRIMKQSSIQ